MTIRRATMNDMQTVLRLYKDARKYMRSQGNSLQWGPSDMPEDSVITDLQRGQLFLGVDEADRPHYVFAFLLGIDHTYRKIKDVEARLAPTAGDRQIILNSFILSGTPSYELRRRWTLEEDKPADKAFCHARNVYTLDDEDCVQEMIEKILR